MAGGRPSDGKPDVQWMPHPSWLFMGDKLIAPWALGQARISN